MRSILKSKLEFLFHENIILYLLLIVLGILLLVQIFQNSAAFGSYASSPSLVVDQETVIGKRVPALALETVASGIVDLNEVQNEYVLLIFLHSDCDFCLKDLPLWKELEMRGKEKNIRVLGVTMETNLKKLVRYKDENSLSFPVLIDREGEMFEVGAVEFTPTKILLTREREIVQVWRGWTTQSSGEGDLGALRLLFDIYPQDLPKY